MKRGRDKKARQKSVLRALIRESYDIPFEFVDTDRGTSMLLPLSDADSKLVWRITWLELVYGLFRIF